MNTDVRELGRGRDLRKRPKEAEVTGYKTKTNDARRRGKRREVRLPQMEERE